MKPVLGKTLQGKRVISQNGLELGNIVDAYFEDTGEMVSLIVKPQREVRELAEYLDRSNFVSVPYKDVKAIGRFVVVEFPFSRE